ncbi:hypothetical protein HKD37_20G055467 [Glycine soja]
MLGAPSYTLAFNTPTTSSLDSYLGFLILNQRKFVVHFRSMVDKIKKKKLLGWKSQSFSLAGRITLAQSHSCIPTYIMQTTLLPSSMCKDIEKLYKDFI